MKYFVVSDIHSFYDELKDALDKAGFDKKNDEHTLIVCGDLFDRGNQSIEVYNFLKSIPQNRCILIRGNHELLFFELLEKKYPETHDFSNGTVSTFCQIANMTKIDDMDVPLYLKDGCTYQYGMFNDFAVIDPACQSLWNEILYKVIEHPITKWLKSKRWKNYYEVDDYIFVHSFIPLQIKECSETKWKQNWPTYKVDLEYLEPVPNWRNCNDFLWDDATWGCPWSYYRAGLFDKEIENGKTLVCGHWHTSDFYKNLDGVTNKGDIYYGKNIIGIDGGVSYDFVTNRFVHPQKVLVI